MLFNYLSKIQHALIIFSRFAIYSAFNKFFNLLFLSQATVLWLPILFFAASPPKRTHALCTVHIAVNAPRAVR